MIEELDDLAKRSGDRFDVDDNVKQRLKALQPYWQNKTHQDEVNANMSELNKLAAKQNVLHRGGISMSGDGHIVPNHEFVMRFGFKGIKEIAAQKAQALDLDQDQKDFYQAVQIYDECSS